MKSVWSWIHCIYVVFFDGDAFVDVTIDWKKYSDINQNKKSWAVSSTVYKKYILCKYVYQVRKFLVFYCKCSRIYFFKYSENFKGSKTKRKTNIEQGARHNCFMINNNIILYKDSFKVKYKSIITRTCTYKFPRLTIIKICLLSLHGEI